MTNVSKSARPPRARRNRAGGYRAGVVAEELRLPRATGIRARVLLVHDPEHAAPWRVGYAIDMPWGGHRAPPTRTGPGAPDRTEALRMGYEAIVQFLDRRSDLDERPRRRAIEAIRALAARLDAPAPTEIVAPLSRQERRRLAACERTITNHLQAWVLVGLALREIRDQRLYRETHATFDAYLRAHAEWGIASRSYAARVIEGATTVEALADTLPIGNTGAPGPLPLPPSESVVRPLLRVDRDQRAEVWRIAVETAQRAGRAAPTAEIVASAVRAWVTPPDELAERPARSGAAPRDERLGPGATPAAPAAETDAASDPCPDSAMWIHDLEGILSSIHELLERFAAWRLARVRMAEVLRRFAEELLEPEAEE